MENRKKIYMLATLILLIVTVIVVISLSVSTTSNENDTTEKIKTNKTRKKSKLEPWIFFTILLKVNFLQNIQKLLRIYDVECPNL